MGPKVFGYYSYVDYSPYYHRHFGLELIGIWLLATQPQHIFLLEFGFNTSLTGFCQDIEQNDLISHLCIYLPRFFFS